MKDFPAYLKPIVLLSLSASGCALAALMFGSTMTAVLLCGVNVGLILAGAAVVVCEPKPKYPRNLTTSRAGVKIQFVSPN